MSKLELTSLNCTNCGASLSGYEGKNEIRCEYCYTHIKVLRPRSVSVTQGNLSSDNFDRLNNYVEILQKAIRAGNFNEGYDYCNKALEVNPNIGSIWENKAICAFWRSVSFLNEDKITISNAREIRTFLNVRRFYLRKVVVTPDNDCYIKPIECAGELIVELHSTEHSIRGLPGGQTNLKDIDGNVLQ